MSLQDHKVHLVLKVNKENKGPKENKAFRVKLVHRDHKDQKVNQGEDHVLVLLMVLRLQLL
jgi:hypothetical protein